MFKRPRRLPFSSFALAAVAILLLTAGCAGPDRDGQASNATSDSGNSGMLDGLFSSQSEERTVPAGTRVAVALDDTLSSEDSRPGETFRAHLTQDVTVDGAVALPAGSTVTGEVTRAEAPKIGGRAKLSLDFRTIEAPSGGTVPFSARFAKMGKSERAKDAAIIGGSTIGGAILGKAVDDDDGTLVGAVVGGVAGAIGAKKTHGKPLVLPDGLELTLELSQPVTVEVEV